MRLDLRLLEHGIRLECAEPGFLGDLAVCFDVSASSGPESTRPIDLRVTLTPSTSDSARLDLDCDAAGDGPESLEGLASVRIGEPTVLASALNLWAVRQSRRYYCFHAGAVTRDGRGILLPAPSHGGKSTLTAALAMRGFAVLSDEVGAIEVATGRLAAFRRALWLRSRSVEALGLDGASGRLLDGGHHILGASDLGAERDRGASRPALVVCPKFEARQSTRLERLRAGEAVIALMESSCSQAQFKVQGLDLVIDLARRLPCYRLVYSDPHDAVAAIEDAFRQASEEAT